MGGEDQQKPLLRGPPSSSESYGYQRRTGTVWTSIAHIITAVIGAGVVSLAWSIAQMGWIAGPLVMVMFAGITVISSSLLCDCYRSPDPENGLIRNHTYVDAVRLNLVWQISLHESYNDI
ncbi:amino acid permease 3-like isoform X2 [Tasmannia lanceolata]|uniref:amino acid permease 3-like isoform X2 n=1 Tax=Tasmannia lanceolata TaxID=3420 RepID=UPI004063396E